MAPASVKPVCHEISIQSFQVCTYVSHTCAKLCVDKGILFLFMQYLAISSDCK